MPLLWALRDILNLKGTKYGCGIGACGAYGACTVHIDGKPVRSCQTRVSAVKGRIAIENGRTVQSNYHQFPLMRMRQSPPVIAAIFAINGTRVRSLLLSKHGFRGG